MLHFFIILLYSPAQQSINNSTFTNFRDTLQYHLSIYKKGQICDWIKLAVQNEFGPEDLTSSFNETLEILIEEWSQINNTALRRIEPIGNGYDRYYLEPNRYSYSNAILLTNLFFDVSKAQKGNESNFRQKLDIIQSQFPKTKEIQVYLSEGIHSVPHSAIYIQTYQPHYRIITHIDSIMLPLYHYIQKIIELKPTAIIAIDGRCGSGKTFLSERIAKFFGMEIVHIDDFYIPKAERPEDWTNKPASHISFERLSKELLEPLFENKTGVYRPFICRIQNFGQEKCVERKSPILVEGSYSLHPNLTNFYDATIFINADYETRMTRLKEREGNRFSMFETTWIPLEEMYLNAFSIPKINTYNFTNN